MRLAQSSGARPRFGGRTYALGELQNGFNQAMATSLGSSEASVTPGAKAGKGGGHAGG